MLCGLRASCRVSSAGPMTAPDPRRHYVGRAGSAFAERSVGTLARGMAEPDRGILNGLPDLDGPRRARETYPVVEAAEGRIAEHRASGLVGFVVRSKANVVVLRDRRGRECPVRLLPGGFIVDGNFVTLVPPRASVSGEPGQTASGSLPVQHKARVAQASRILVEGVHDAELVERVWGDDLRAEGIVV